MSRRPSAAATAGAVDVFSDDAPAIACRREFSVSGDGDVYSMQLVDVPIAFELYRPRRSNGDLSGQIRVTTELSGTRAYGKVLTEGTFNCSSPTARRTLARHLEELARTPQIDWARLLEEFSIRVLTAEREGRPSVDLRTVAPRESNDVLEVYGIRIFDNVPTILFGDGGTFKASWP